MKIPNFALNSVEQYGKRAVNRLIEYKPKSIGLLEYKPLASDTVQLPRRAGKHKIPRFIYHMTSKENYKSMLQDGVIKTSNDEVMGKGVFATELTNLFKRWRESEEWGYLSLQEELLGQVAKDGNEIVILRIPTEKLNHDLLKIRSQNTLICYMDTDRSNILDQKIRNEMKTMPDQSKNWIERYRNLFHKYVFKSNDKMAQHCAKGAPATESNLYKQRKHAIEYIYQDNIPMSDVEKIGEVDIEKLRRSPGYDYTKPMRSIFMALLKGTPEQKGAELLKC